MQSLRRMSVFTAVCVDLTKYRPMSCDMNIIMWLFSHLACKKVYHITYLYAQLVCLYFAMEIKRESAS